MMRKSTFLLALSAVLSSGGAAWAQAAAGFGSSEGMFGTMLRSLTDRLEQIFSNLPALGDYLARLPQQFGWRETAILVGIVVAGLAAEWLARILLQRARLGICERHAGAAP